MVGHVILLDAGPLGLVTNPRRMGQNLACTQWLQTMIAGGSRVIVPEIADYEVRRELLRAGKISGSAQLDALAEALEYLPINTQAMHFAAQLWAEARRQGQPTASDNTIDADMILVAQGLTMAVPEFVIATTNVGHLSRFAPAELWTNITAP